MGVSPKNGWFLRENTIEMNDGWCFSISEPPIANGVYKASSRVSGNVADLAKSDFHW